MAFVRPFGLLVENAPRCPDSTSPHPDCALLPAVGGLLTSAKPHIVLITVKLTQHDLTMLLRSTALCLSLLAHGGAGQLAAQDAAAPGGDKVLATCAEVRQLRAADADAGREARLEGVVTVVPGLPYSGLVVQDATDAIWVDDFKARTRGLLEKAWDTVLGQLKIGDRVRLEGVTERGGFAPVLLPRRLEWLASGVALPDAPMVTVPEVLTGKYDAQRVTMRGVVQQTSVSGESAPQWLILKLVNAGGHVFLRVPRSALPPETELQDTEISVSGTILARHNSRAEMSGAILVTERAEDIRVLRPSVPPEKAPLLSLASLRPYEPSGASPFRRRIVGTVTYWEPGRRLILQEGKAAVEVTTHSTERIALGSRVEAAGFISLPHPLCRMENAVVRVLRSGEAPAPVEITLPGLLAASDSRKAIDWQRSVFDYHNRLVRLTGTLVDAFDEPGREGHTLLLRSGGLLLPVRWNGNPAADGRSWRSRSELAVTGIVKMEPDSDAVGPSEPTGKGDVSLLMRDAGDVQVLAAASWWTVERLVNAAWAGLALFTVGLLVVLFLARRVRRQAVELAGHIALQNEAEIRFQATLAERNRLGADMHDGLQQFLAGLSMQLEAAHGSVERGRDAAPALQAARKLLLSLREDFRHCINALRDTEAEMHIPDILERTSAIIRACHPVEIEVEVEGKPVPLPGKAVANLMLIAQEAASNAVRHGRAHRIVLRCRFTREAVAVEVEDDGTGLDPGAIPAEAGHYGLVNMRGRIEALGGSLRIESQPGQGARITARVPLPLDASPEDSAAF